MGAPRNRLNYEKFNQLFPKICRAPQYVAGLNEDIVKANVRLATSTATGSANCAVGIGIDVSNANSAHVMGMHLAAWGTYYDGESASAHYQGFPGLGYRKLYWIEYGSANTITWYGDNNLAIFQSGIYGEGKF